MGNEEKRLTCRQKRCVDNTLCQLLHWRICTCQCIRKRPALRLSIANLNATIHDIEETIINISFSSQNKMTRGTLLTTQLIKKSWTHSSASRTATDKSGRAQRFGARRTVEAVSSIANSPSAEIATPSLNRTATLPSAQELATASLTQDVANELLRGEFKDSFVKILDYLISSLIKVSASNDVSMHFHGHTEQRYSSVLPIIISISGICLYPINFKFTPYFLTS